MRVLRRIPAVILLVGLWGCAAPNPSALLGKSAIEAEEIYGRAITTVSLTNDLTLHRYLTIREDRSKIIRVPTRGELAGASPEQVQRYRARNCPKSSAIARAILNILSRTPDHKCGPDYHTYGDKEMLTDTASIITDSQDKILFWYLEQQGQEDTYGPHDIEGERLLRIFLDWQAHYHDAPPAATTPDGLPNKKGRE